MLLKFGEDLIGVHEHWEQTLLLCVVKRYQVSPFKFSEKWYSCTSEIRVENILLERRWEMMKKRHRVVKTAVYSILGPKSVLQQRLYM